MLQCVTGNKLAKPTSSQPKPTFEGLPPEIRVMVLQNLPNRLDLRRCIIASPAYKISFALNHRRVLSNVIHNEIGPHVFPEALARLRFKQLRQLRVRLRIAEEQWRDIYTDYHITRTTLCDTANLTEATFLDMVRFHRIVQDMLECFFEYATSFHPTTRKPQSAVKQASKTERRRISRALYRFELLCSMLQRERRFRTWRASELTEDCFFNGYQPWDLEEVACIRDYLNKMYLNLILSLRKFRKGVSRVEHAKILIEICLSDGLTEARSLMVCREKRAKQLAIKRCREYFQLKMTQKVLDLESGMRFGSVISELDRRGVRSGAFDRYRVRLTGPMTNQYRTPIDFESEEIGPNDAFTVTWSQSRMCEAKFADIGAEQLRSWGYVMWDRWRLDQWRISPHHYSFRRVTYDEWLNS